MPRHLPDSFYCQQHGEEQLFTSNPPGTMSVPRLINQQPAFLKWRPAMVRKPKTLVFNIWTKSLDPVAVKNKLVELMQQGFTIYLSTKEKRKGKYGLETRCKLQLLDDNWINQTDSIDWENHYLSSEIPLEEFESANLHTLITRDELLVLNHFDMECLLADDFKLNTRTLHESDFPSYWNDRNTFAVHYINTRTWLDSDFPSYLYERSLFAEHYNRPIGRREKPVPSHKMDSEFERRVYYIKDIPWMRKSVLPGSGLRYQRTYIESAVFNVEEPWTPYQENKHPYDWKRNYRQAVLRDEHITELLAGRSITSLRQRFFPEQDLKHIEELVYTLPGYTLPPPQEVINYHDAYAIRYLEKQFEELRQKGTLEEESYQRICEEIEESRRHDQEMLDYNNSEIDYNKPQNTGPAESDIDRLLAHTPNLRSLSLGRVKRGGNWPPLSKLEKLRVAYVKDSASFFNLMQQAPNLRRLELYKTELPAKTKWPAFANIRVLVWETLSNNSAVFLQSFPNLEELRINDKLQLNGFPQLPQLKKLALGGALEGDILGMLERCPRLQSLSLWKYKGPVLNEQAVMAVLENCPELTSIHIAGVRYKDIPFWQAILEYAKNLDADSKRKIQEAINSSERRQAYKSTFGKKLAGFGTGVLEMGKGFYESLRDKDGFGKDKGQSGNSNSGQGGKRGRNPGAGFGHMRLPAFQGSGRKPGAGTRPGTSGAGGAAAGSSMQTSIQNQRFDIESMRSHQTSKHDVNPKNFKYQGTNKSLNQGMIIEQLNQYCKLTGQNIPDIQGGMCNALSHLCKDTAPGQWLSLLSMIRDWNGTRDGLTRQHYDVFNRFLAEAGAYQFVSVQGVMRRLWRFDFTETWIGEQILAHLDNLQEPCVLFNPWHAICVHPLAGGMHDFFVYNPSFKEGGFAVTKAELPDILRASFGSLNLVSVEGSFPVTPQIPDPDRFFAEGGLFSLLACVNRKAMIAAINNAPLPKTPQALQGLFLRDVSGTPAWWNALKTGDAEVEALTLTLLAEHLQQNPRNGLQIWQNSLSAVENVNASRVINHVLAKTRKNAYLDALIKYALMTELGEQKTANKNQTMDERAMKPEAVLMQTPDSLQTLFQTLFTSEAPSRLIQLSNSKDIQSLRFALQKYGSEEGDRPVIYIDNPEMLTLSNPFVALQPDGKTGVFTKGPGGPIYEKLRAGGKPPVIVVNFDNFPRSAIVRFNALIDENPHADGLDLPEGTTVIALQNPDNTDAYKGGDLLSRFKVRQRWPANLPIPAQPGIRFHSEQAVSDAAGSSMHANSLLQPYVIDLYNSADWKERLLGYWAPRANDLALVEGELVKALRSGRPVTFANAPRHRPEFDLFWKEAFQTGSIYYEGQTIDLPPAFSLAFREGYDWESLSEAIATLRTGIDCHSPVLNNWTSTEFLNRYVCIDDNESLLAIEGLLEKEYANSTLQLNITHTLSDSELAKFLDACNQHQVKLNLQIAEGVRLPDALEQKLLSDNKVQHKNILPPVCAFPQDHTLIWRSTDPDSTRLCFDNALAIDISECEPRDLLDSIDGFFDKEQIRLRFKNTRGLIPQCLEQYPGRPLVLTGHFSREIVQALTPLLLERHRNPQENQLILLPANAKEVEFSFLPCRDSEVTTEERAERLAAKFPGVQLDEVLIDSESQCSLFARARHQLACQEPGDCETKSSWEGLEKLPPRLAPDVFDSSHSAAIAERFDSHRSELVESRLKHSPFVVITGLTGVGKSTWMEGHYTHTHPNIHYGESAIKAWAQDKRPGRKTLFLDEANLHNRNWSEFEGLFETPRTVRINNEILELDDQHCVVYACNPVSYGDKRKLPSLFERHGNAVVFEPMPMEYIYERMLKPLLQWHFQSEQEMVAITGEIFRVYRFLCERSIHSVLISPRELVMMARMVIAHQNLDNDPRQVAQHYVRLIAKDLVPAKHKADFNRAFPPVVLQDSATSVLRQAENFASSSKTAGNRQEFLITNSRKPVANLLEDLVHLREICREQQLDAPKDFLYGGLGGIILEGEPGQGKSELVRFILKVRGYQENKPNKNLHYGEKGYYNIPASMQEDAKRALLLQAFHEGAVVIMDEINSASLMEDFLNDLLMGKDSITKLPPQNPGFLVIGTQNAASLGGRLRASNALQRRVINVQLENYGDEEMREILMDAGLTRARAYSLISIYHTLQKWGATFRDVLFRARDILQETNPEFRLFGEDDDEDMDVDWADSDGIAPGPQGFSDENVSAAFERVSVAIDRLYNKGKSMQDDYSMDDAGKEMGRNAMELAIQLRVKVSAIRQDPQNRALKQDFHETLKQGYEASNQHRNTWYPLLDTIWRVFRDGLLSFCISAACHGGFFAPRTKRQMLVHKVRKAFDALSLPEDINNAEDCKPAEISAAASTDSVEAAKAESSKSTSEYGTNESMILCEGDGTRVFIR